MFLSLFLLLSFPAFAEDTSEPAVNPGRFTVLEQNQRAPFGGVLFDADATSYLLTLPKYYEEKYKLDLDLAVGQNTAELQLEIDKLQIRLDTQESQYLTAIEQKDLEIAQLQDTVKKNSKVNPWIWGTIGAVIGAGTTVAIVRATTQ